MARGATSPSSPALPRARFAPSALLALLVASMALIICGLTAPAVAMARSYSIPSVDVQGEVTPAGDLHLVETRQFSFDGHYSAVWWTFHDLAPDARIQINDLTITRLPATAYADAAPASGDGAGSVDDPVGDGSSSGLGAPVTETLSAVPFNNAWRTSGGPGVDSYSVDVGTNTVYVFMDVSDENVIVTFDVTIIHGIAAYKDVGELYWKYISEDWEVPAENVSASFSLPVPSGVEVVPGDNVLAWGHGPLDGSLSINPDGTVTYQVDHVEAGQYAEARILFPVSWLTELPASMAALHENVVHKDAVLDEERRWADEANWLRIQGLLFIVGSLALSAGLLIWALVVFRRWGRELTPRFDGEYWREVPDPELSPAVIGRLCRWDNESQQDFTATLMDLTVKGALRICKGSYPQRRRTVEEYYLVRVPEKAAELTDELELKALDILFELIGGGEDSIWFSSIERFGKDHPKEFATAMNSWQGELSSQVIAANLFEAKSASKQSLMHIVTALYGLLMVVLMFVFMNFWPIIAAVPTVVALLVIARFTSRRTQRGADDFARSQALKRWLKDFSRLDERPPTDVIVWGRFMVYAYVLGVAKEAIKALRSVEPQLFDDDVVLAYNMALPWWIWYAGAFGHPMPLADAGSLFDSMMTNTISSVSDALGAAGGFADGGGFGGGFSAGGGFGGGMGGGAR